MRMARLRFGGKIRPVLASGGELLDLTELVHDFDPAFWIDGRFEMLASIDASIHEALPRLDPVSDDWLAPVPNPSKLICIGLNYRDHVREAGVPIPLEPVVFMKARNSVVGPYGPIHIPPGSTHTDYEVEMALIIGKGARYLDSELAATGVIGAVTVANDVSERHFQLERGGQWVKGKSFETFSPLGPFMVTPDELDILNLRLGLKVNDEIRQDSSTSEMIFSPAHIVWYLSQFMVLEPGDVICTGTPPGVALGMSSPEYLRAGDVVQASIEGVGTQRNVCIAAPTSTPTTAG